MSTGSQGEPMAVLARMANLEHQIEIGEGDTVILASSLIPGNENAVYRVINGLTKLGANVVHKGNAKVHVSGHAAAGELLYATTSSSRRTSCRCTASCGTWSRTRARDRDRRAGGARILAENGTVVDLKDGVPRVVGQLDLGFVYVDGSSVGEITDADLKDRRILAEEGFISIFVAIDPSDRPRRRRARDPGPRFRRGRRGLRRRAPADRGGAAEAARNGTRDLHTYRQVVRRTVGRWVNTKHRRRPMIIPVIVSA